MFKQGQMAGQMKTLWQIFSEGILRLLLNGLVRKKKCIIDSSELHCTCRKAL